MNTTQNDFQVVEGCRKGDKESFRQLFNRHSSWMMGVCLRYSKNQEDAQDVLQDCLVKIFKAIPKFTYLSDAQFRSWLKTIVVNTSINYIKSQSNQLVSSMEIQDYQLIDESVQETVEDVDLSKEQLMDFIQELPLGYRTVFNLYVFEEMGHKEIAKVLNISENTSKTQLFKARNMLKNKISISINQVQI